MNRVTFLEKFFYNTILLFCHNFEHSKSAFPNQFMYSNRNFVNKLENNQNFSFFQLWSAKIVLSVASNVNWVIISSIAVLET